MTGEVRIRELNYFEIRPYSHFAVSGDLTYAGAAALTRGGAVAFGADVQGTPAGLALAYFVRPQAVRIAALTVAESMRRRGLGSRLYHKLLTCLCQRGVVLADILGGDSEPFLQKFSWNTGAKLATVFRFSARVGEAPWLREELAAPAGFEVFPWAECTPEDHSHAQAIMAADPVAQRLDPFAAGQGEFYPPASKAIRHNGQLAAWCVTHVVSPGVLQYTSVYAAPRIRRTLAPVTVLNHSIREHLRRSEELPYGMQAVPPELPDIERFANKRLAPWADSVQRVHVWWKTLDQGTYEPSYPVL